MYAMFEAIRNCKEEHHQTRLAATAAAAALLPIATRLQKGYQACDLQRVLQKSAPQIIQALRTRHEKAPGEQHSDHLDHLMQIVQPETGRYNDRVIFI